MSTVYLIGICGTAMATLAALLKARGFDVRGSDENIYPPMSDFLIAQGITPLSGYRVGHITDDLDIVVIGNAVSRGNPEVEAVLDRKIRYCSLPEMLRDEFLWGSRSVVVAGTHGKTTTASMVAWLLVEANVDPSFFVGGIPLNFDTSFRVGDGKLFVIEGDEYDSAFFDKTAKFLKYLPDVVVVNGIEYDHADIYPDINALRLTFTRLLRLVPRNGSVLLCADDDEALALRDAAHSEVETFGLSAQADWRAVDIRCGHDTTAFDVFHTGAAVAHVTLPLLGAFNVRNALAAVAAGAVVGVAPEVTALALGRFRGVRRRLEVCGIQRGVTVYDDFAHHPTAVRETLKALRIANPSSRIWAVFEPRSATACRRVFQDAFAEALGEADEVVVSSVFRSTLPEADRLSEARLVSDLEAQGVKARHIATVDEIVELIATGVVPKDIVVMMSNGSFGGIQERLVERLRDDERPGER